MPTATAIDAYWMAYALRLAATAQTRTSPNPAVGCVILQGNKVVGEGATLPAGQAHAEVVALAAAGWAARGATVYVTLEPCNHHGRTPPCVDALIKAEVSRVVIAIADPNPLTAGQGIARLHAAGIITSVGILADLAREHHAGFLSRMEQGRPRFTLKLGASVDGRTALGNGVSQWITGVAAREDVQRLRAASCAIVTGVGTVLADDPRLTVRDAEGKLQGRQPRIVVVDTRLRTPLRANVVQTAGTVIVTAMSDVARHQPYLDQGCEVQLIAQENGRIDLVALAKYLAQAEFNDVLIEAGATLSGAWLASGMVDALYLYLAPMLLGSQARGLAVLPDWVSLDQAPRWRWHDVRPVGDDLRIQLRPSHPITPQ